MLAMLIIVLAGMSVSCDPAFNPIKKNNRHFSVFGYLNASADTQYVRIEKLRDGKPAHTPKDLDAEVTLTNVSTDRTVAMRDSVFEYYLQGKAHNFYTTMDINPGQKYKLQVSGSGDAISTAEVTIPEDFSNPKVLANDEYTTKVEIPEMERLIAVKAIYHSCATCFCGTEPGEPPAKCPTEPGIQRITYPHLADTLYRGKKLIANINRKKDVEKIALDFPKKKPPVVIFYDLVIVAGSSNWPNFLKLDREAVALPDVATNVENGTGLLGGIVSDTLNLDKNSCAPCISCKPSQVTCNSQRVQLQQNSSSYHR